MKKPLKEVSTKMIAEMARVWCFNKCRIDAKAGYLKKRGVEIKWYWRATGYDFVYTSASKRLTDIELSASDLFANIAKYVHY